MMRLSGFGLVISNGLMFGLVLGFDVWCALAGFGIASGGLLD